MIKTFTYKSERTEERLLEIIQNGVKQDSIAKSVKELRKITAELEEIGRKQRVK